VKDTYGHFAVPAVFIGAIVVGALVYGNVFRHQAPPKWDEAQHMLFAWQIWADFTQGNIVKLLRDSHAQFYWSFLHSWWAAGFMAVFGVTDFGARISSFAAMILSVVLAFATGKELYKERVPWAGLMAVALLLMFRSLPGLAAQCMIELPAMMMAFLALLVYIRADQQQTAMGYTQFGCALGATFLMKYNFGLALIGAFTVVAITEFLFNRVAFDWRSVFFVLMPLVIVVFFWLIVPEFRLNQYFETLVNRPQGPQEFGWAYVMYYPQVVYAEVGWWALLCVGALICALPHLKNRVIRLLFCVCVVYFGIIFFHQTKGPRHIYPLYPALILLTAFAVASWTNRLFKEAPRLRARMLLLAMLAMFFRPVTVLGKPQIPSEEELVPAKIAAYLGDALKDGKSVFVIGEFNAVPAHLIAWELRKRGSRIPVHQSMDYKQALEGRSAFTPGAGDSVDFSQLVELLKELSVDTVITVGLKKTSPFYDGYYRAFNAWEQRYVDRFDSLAEYLKTASRDFTSVGLSVTIYRVH